MQESFINAEEKPVKIKMVPKRYTVIKCKQCKELFYMNYFSSHECFFLPNAEIKKSKRSNDSLDLMKHCGVIDSNQNPCKNGFSCRLHTLDEKRKVEGRLYSLDVLLKMTHEDKKKTCKIKEVVDIDDDIKNMILNIKPVATKVWHFPTYKYESFGVRSLFYTYGGKRSEKAKKNVYK